MNNWGGLFFFDPHDLENMFSNADSMSELPSVWGEPQEENFSDLYRVKDLLHMIPPREADFIELYFFQKVRQTVIAEAFNVSQPTVCYRLRRAISRLKFLLDIYPYTPEEIASDLSLILKDPVDVKIMVGMLQTTCQSDVARDLGVTQGFVRHRFLRSISTLESSSDKGREYVGVFNKVRSNSNMLKNSNRSSWSDEIIFRVG